MDDANLVFDNLDVDLVVKVLSHTAFSPFFCLWIPLLYRAQGAPWDTPVIVSSSLWFAAVCIFWILNYSNNAWRNGLGLMSKRQRFNWEDQIVLITGGASGIGALLANTLAVRNVAVVVLDVNPIVTENDNIAYYQCDVSDWESVDAVAKKIIEEIGHPTVIVNNAGVVQGKLILDLSPEDVKQTFDTNVLSHFWILKAFLPEMIKQKTGHIVTMSSVLGLVGVAQMSDYSASKAALVNLHESLRYELDKRYNVPNIRTTLVMPGHTMTPLFSRAALPTANWYKFLVPSLPPHAVAKAIIVALDEHESRTIYMPFYANFVRWVGILPSYCRDLFHWVSKADYSMRGFVKVSGRRSDEGPPPHADDRLKGD